MSGLFRSESMVYARLVLSEEAAYDTVKQLGRFGKVHIVDLSLRSSLTGPSDRTSHFKKRVAACVYYEHKLAHFTTLFTQYGVGIPSIDIAPQPMPNGDCIDTTRSMIDPIESTLTRNILYARDQRDMLNTLLERLYVLQVSSGRPVTSDPDAGFGVRVIVTAPRYGSFEPNARAAAEEKSSLLGVEMGETEADEENEYEAYEAKADPKRVVPYRPHIMNTRWGVIAASNISMLERMIFRLSRGNVICTLTPLVDPMSDPADPNTLVSKVVFQLTFVGDQLATRLSKLITHFGGCEYDVPIRPDESEKTQASVMRQVADARQVLAMTETQVRGNLRALAWDGAAQTSPYVNILYALHVEKAICDVLRQTELERFGSCLLRLDAWCPSHDYDALQLQLKHAVALTGVQPAACQRFDPSEVDAQPPTFFQTTKFTSPYQGIVDTYGVPRYKEVNPGLFTIISFPFLFGVMYGDIGHGAILCIGALYFIWNEAYYNRRVREGKMDEIMGMIFGGRYMLIAMGAFAMYAGFIYNDCFSIPLNLFGSRWSVPSARSGADSVSSVSSFGVYPFGVDPGWYHTTNELAFFNSLKMKLAVTIGVAQMTFGIVLGAFNNIHFHVDSTGLPASLFLEFIPRMTFLLATFGYMIFIVVLKLCTDWSAPGAGSAPNLVQTMIEMFLAPGRVDEEKILYRGQATVQSVLLCLALIAVPVMLVAQPLRARAQHKAIYGTTSQTSSYARVDHVDRASAHDDDDETESSLSDSSPATGPVAEEGAASGHGGHDSDPRSPQYDFANHAITQGIHTIEFVLGTVSNTASYLRLWALSLAHAELSDVFWKKMISQYGLEGTSPIIMVIGFAAWACATFAVLLAMDVLECFLHALRLHWVEFQNKFFAADGYAYAPFSYDTDIGDD